jgi:hypothetical protein
MCQSVHQLLQLRKHSADTYAGLLAYLAFDQGLDEDFGDFSCIRMR